MSKTFNNHNGFTLMEIIAVLVILGILAVVVISRSTNLDAEVYTGAETLKSHLRYAQTQAMNRSPLAGNTDVVVGIRYDSGTNQYWLFRGTNPNDNNNISLLPEDTRYVTVDRRINLTDKKIRFSPDFTIFFDNYGIPYSDYNKNTALADDFIITVAPYSGGPSLTVTITPQTGFIP